MNRQSPAGDPQAIRWLKLQYFSRNMMEKSGVRQIVRITRRSWQLLTTARDVPRGVLIDGSDDSGFESGRCLFSCRLTI
jgi:hypothetical protein